MKRLVCEMCGSTELIKQDGVFVCQSCKTKYSVEEARKMMTEVNDEVVGTVNVNKPGNHNNLVQLARYAFEDEKFEEAYGYSSEAMMIVPDDPEMVALQGLSILGKEKVIERVPAPCENSMKRVKELLVDENLPFDKKNEIIKSIITYINIMKRFQKFSFIQQRGKLDRQKEASRQSGIAYFRRISEINDQIREIDRIESEVNNFLEEVSDFLIRLVGAKNLFL